MALGVRSFSRALLFAMPIVTLICSCILVHTLVGSLFRFTHLPWFIGSMQWSEHWSSLLVLTMTEYLSPSRIHISFSDEATRAKFFGSANASDIVISNHQIYTDWLYLWALFHLMGKGGNVKIMLKKSIQWVPLIGFGMKMVGWIFLARKWRVDSANFVRRVRRLVFFKPFSLLIFPEGTTLAPETREKSQQYARAVGAPLLKHCLLPRITGLQKALVALEGHIDGIWNFTVMYGGVPRRTFYSEDHFTIKGLILHAIRPQDIYVHVEFIPISSVPFQDDLAFEQRLHGLFMQKDQMLTDFYDWDQLRKKRRILLPANVIVPLVTPREQFQAFLAVLAVSLFWLVLLFHIATHLCEKAA
jgi:lysocardiolipin and lysophospholipid acyltransferase